MNLLFMAMLYVGATAGATETNGEPAMQPDIVLRNIPGYQLAWLDEFNVDGKPDAAKWNFEKGFCRNEELQWYQAENAFCRGGVLVIEGRRERVRNPNFDAGSEDWRKQREYAEYTSASLNTWDRHSWKLSETLIEVRARLTIDEGYFPAIWTTGPGRWPFGGEVDMMEYYQGRIRGNFAWGTEARYKPHWHPYANPNHPDQNTPRVAYFTERDPAWEHTFHVWRLEGGEEWTRIYLDGELINEVSHDTAKNPDTKWSDVTYPFNERHSLILNLAMGGPGGDPSKASFPLLFEIDYARVYCKEP